MKKLIIVFLSLLTMNVFALSHADVEKMPVGQHFTTGDWQLFFSNQKFTLEHAKDHEKITWKNPATGHSGYFIPLKSTVKNHHSCRQLEIVKMAQGLQGKRVETFCKVNRVWDRIE